MNIDTYMADELKTCTKCQSAKPPADFYRNGQRLRPDCKKCSNHRNAEAYRQLPEGVRAERAARAKRAYQHNPRIQRDGELRRKFGISLEDFERMLEAQDFLCRLCQRPPTGRRPSLHVDHDHATGRVRGLLCQNCNVGLGHFKDSPEILRRAIDYLG